MDHFGVLVALVTGCLPFGHNLEEDLVMKGVEDGGMGDKPSDLKSVSLLSDLI